MRFQVISGALKGRSNKRLVVRFYQPDVFVSRCPAQIADSRQFADIQPPRLERGIVPQVRREAPC